ncbi:hypothetical protein TNCV_1436651 [Trichonephila clavipes]|nr:hypothetical protein TNCV_1436651 [Trichonephila clavipes]
MSACGREFHIACMSSKNSSFEAAERTVDSFPNMAHGKSKNENARNKTTAQIYGPNRFPSHVVNSFCQYENGNRQQLSV